MVSSSYLTDLKMTGKKWFWNLRKRPSSLLREPQNTSMARLKDFSNENVSQSCDILEKKM
jgi:hypothetical protein